MDEGSALDERIRRADPLGPGWSPEPPDGPQARALLEHVMSTPVVEPTAQPTPRRSTRRWWWTGAIAAAVILVGAGGLWLANRDDSGTAEDAGPAPVTFQLPGAGVTIGSCLPITEFTPDPTTEAFAGTVTEVDASTVTLDVDRWYTSAGGQADVVTLAAGTDVPVSLDGVEFNVGQRYLVSVLSGEVLICGISAPATPELEARYEQWYGS